MIFKLEHIALTTRLNARTLVPYFENRGFKKEFYETNRPSLESTRNMFEKFRPTFEVALFRSPHSFAVETVIYDELQQGAANAIPVLSNVASGEFEFQQTETVLGRRFQKGILRELRLPVYAEQVGGGATVLNFSELVIPTADLKNSSDFWEKCGFQTKTRDDKIVRLAFPGLSEIIPKPLHLTLILDPSATPWRLDKEGFNFIALVSHSVEAESKALSEKGLQPTAIESGCLNGKNLRIFYVVGPGGEIVEIVEVVR